MFRCDALGVILANIRRVCDGIIVQPLVPAALSSCEYIAASEHFAYTSVGIVASVLLLGGLFELFLRDWKLSMVLGLYSGAVFRVLSAVVTAPP